MKFNIRKFGKFILTTINWCMGMMLCLAVLTLDSHPWIPVVMFLVSLSWLAVVGYCDQQAKARKGGF